MNLFNPIQSNPTQRFPETAGCAAKTKNVNEVVMETVAAFKKQPETEKAAKVVEIPKVAAA